MLFSIVARDCQHTESKETMITQTIKRWLRNVFAWWPWKHTPPVTYKQASGPPGMNTSQEGIARSAEGTASQTSITPRLSTIKERLEHPISAQNSATNDIAETSPPTSLLSPTDSAAEPGDASTFPAPSAPTPQQRLEFLRYLVKRGIINEGSEDM